MLAYLFTSAWLGGAEGTGVDGEDMVSWVAVVRVGIVRAAVVVVIGVVHVDDSVLVKIKIWAASVGVALVRVISIEDAVAVVIGVVLVGETIAVEIAGGATMVRYAGVVVIRVEVWVVWARTNIITVIVIVINRAAWG